jgi:uncharacterized membrane protein YqaE (UPF0057 family)
MNNFSRAKYYNFGHHDPVVTFNKTNRPAGQEVKPNIAISAPSVSEVNTPTALSEAKSPAQVLNTQKKERRQLVRKAVIATVSRNIETKIKAIAPVAPEEITASKSIERGGTIPMIVLIILAIIIPPLAIYLHDQTFRTRFWVVLILWLLGAGFLFGLVGEIGLFWLAAIIWALIVVTGSAGSV